MDLLQVKCIIHIGYKDNYSIYTSAGVIQSQGDTPDWGRQLNIQGFETLELLQRPTNKKLAWITWGNKYLSCKTCQIIVC